MEALASVADLERHLQKEFDDPDSAAQALELASGAVRAYCGWDISETTETLHAEGDNTTVLSLPTMCLTDVTDTRINGLDIDVSELRHSRRGQVYRARGWPRHARIELDVTHGYTDVPELVRLVVLDVASRQMSNPSGLVSATVGPVSRTWGASTPGGTLSALHERLLDRYAI